MSMKTGYHGDVSWRSASSSEMVTDLVKMAIFRVKVAHLFESYCGPAKYGLKFHALELIYGHFSWIAR